MGRRAAKRPYLLIALALLLALRLLAAVLIAPEVVADGQGYTASARRLLETGTYAYPMYGETFWTRTADDALVFRDSAREEFHAAPSNAFTMPGYPVFVAGVWTLTGGDDPWLAVRLVQAILSVATAWLVFRIASRFGDRVGWIALTACAAYPPFTLANSYIGTEVLFCFLFTATVTLVLAWMDTARPSVAVAAGLLAGAGFMVRPSAALWAAGAAAFATWGVRRHGYRALAGFAAFALAAALVVSPWLVRNFALYDEPVTVGTSSGGNIIQGFWQDSHERTPWPWDRGGVEYSEHDRAVAAITDAVYAAGPASETDDRPMLEYFGPASTALTGRLLAEYPAAVISARASSVAASLFWPHAVSPSAAGGVPFTIAWVAHTTLLVLSLAGLAWLPRRPDAWLVASAPLYFVGIHAIVFPLWRYYFPALACGMIIAAVGIDRLTAHMLARANRPRAAD